MLTLNAECHVAEVGHELALGMALVDNKVVGGLTRTRATGDSLKVYAAFQSLLKGGKEALFQAKTHGLEPRVNVTVDSSVIVAVQAAAETGAILIPEAAHLLGGLHAKAAEFTQKGVKFDFRAGTPNVTRNQRLYFDAALKKSTKEHLKRVEKISSWELPAEDSKWVREHDAQVVYTDGSYAQAFGIASWAYYVDEETSGSGIIFPATSTQAESAAVVEALKALKGAVLIVTDCLSASTGKESSVLHCDEEKVRAQLQSMLKSRQVRILNVHGHSHCPGNLAVDKLASTALTSFWARISKDPVLVEWVNTLKLNAQKELKKRRVAKAEDWYRRQRAEQAHERAT